MQRPKTILVSLLVALGLGIGGVAQGEAPEITEGSLIVALDLVAEGITAPIYLTHAGDRSGRRFVVDQIGYVWIIDKNGTLLPEPFLDVTDVMVEVNPGFDERGLLGLAFHPNYRRNGRFFVRYEEPREPTDFDSLEGGCAGTSRGCHSAVVAEYHVSADPNKADPNSARVLLRVAEPEFNHDGGTLAFGPRERAGRRGRPHRYLYISLGDGGGAHDQLHRNPPHHGVFGNAQNLLTPSPGSPWSGVLGAVLRIDVDSPPAPGKAYAIPPDNPFVGTEGPDEVYAYGLRNPYRFSFDDGPGGDGRLFLADVGQNVLEEIDIIEKGGNYGWAIKEGTNCFDPFNPTVPLPTCPDTGSQTGDPLIDPIAQYPHPAFGNGGISVTGGFVYRGSKFAALRGKYVFGDWSNTFGTGSARLFYLDADNVSGGGQTQIFEFRMNTPQLMGRYLPGIGEDEQGEIYLLTSEVSGPRPDSNGMLAGKVWRIVNGTPDRVEICHVPPGNAGNSLTITVGGAALPAHIAHGDALGPCAMPFGISR